MIRCRMVIFLIFMSIYIFYSILFLCSKTRNKERSQNLRLPLGKFYSSTVTHYHHRIHYHHHHPRNLLSIISLHIPTRDSLCYYNILLRNLFCSVLLPYSTVLLDE